MNLDRADADTIDMMEQICKSYSRHADAIKDLENEIQYFQKRVDDSSGEAEKQIFQNHIHSLIEEKKFHSKDVLFFNRAMLSIGGRIAWIMKQLYVEQISWDFITDAEGRHISRGAVSKNRKKGLEMMADIFRREQVNSE